MLGSLIRKLQPALKRTQVMWSHKKQIRAASSASFQLLEDSLGEFITFQPRCMCECTRQNHLLTPVCVCVCVCVCVNSPELHYGGTPMRFNYVWLRDHCRSAASYNPQTNQRNVDTGSIDLSIRPDSTSVRDGHLVLTCKL